MTTPVLNKEGLAAALDAANELVCDGGAPVHDYVNAIVSAYLSASLPADVAEAVKRLEQFPAYTTVNIGKHRELFNKDMAEAAALISALSADNASLAGENGQLRNIISQCAAALPNGAFIAPFATVEFMALLPKEISGVCEQLRADAASSVAKEVGRG